MQSLVQPYIDDLELLYPELRDLFVCPICLRGFSLGAVERGETSRAHVFPKAAFGRILIVPTCRLCNSRLGSKQDASVVEQVRLDQLVSSLTPQVQQRKVRIGGEKIKGVVGFNPVTGKGRMIVLADEAREYQMSRLQKELKEGELLGDLGSPDPWRVQVGFLTSAYLLMFHLFGYTYVLSPALDMVRKQILCADDHVLTGFSFLSLDQHFQEPVVRAILQPLDWQCFIIAFYDTITLLPKTSDFDLQIYKVAGSLPENAEATIPLSTQDEPSILYEIEYDDNFRSVDQLISFGGYDDGTYVGTYEFVGYRGADFQPHEVVE
jgi:hypothetical protein